MVTLKEKLVHGLIVAVDPTWTVACAMLGIVRPANIAAAVIEARRSNARTLLLFLMVTSIMFTHVNFQINDYV